MTVVDLEPQIRGLAGRVSEAAAEELAARIMAAAGDVARQEAVFLELVGEFDAVGAVDWWSGIRSTAHWLSWACSIAAGTAREHVRVARALRRMPVARAAFARGELTYSKVRELTRVADEVGGDDKAVSAGADPKPAELLPSERSAASDQAVPRPPTGPAELNEEGLVELARSCTASQLARTVAGWRAARGSSRDRRSRQRVAWVVQDDGSVHFTAVLPPEQGAALIAAVQAATDANTEPEPMPGQEIPEDQVSESGRDARLQQTRVEALTEIANHYLESRPEDRSGADRTMVVIEINAQALESAERDAAEDDQDAAGPGSEPTRDAAERSRGNGETPSTVPICRVRGGAALEPSDARRALCDSAVLGVIIDQAGMPLAVGREERLVTKYQRRALMIRDGCCQFPGCGRTRHLKAHHRISWLAGGRTDLENLILLCQTHHTLVHEDQLAISVCEVPDCRIRWRFTRPDGSVITPLISCLNAPCPWHPGRNPAFRAANDQLVADWESRLRDLDDQAARLRTAYQHVHNTKHPDAARVFPVGGGEGFRLLDAVDALFGHTHGPRPGITQAA